MLRRTFLGFPCELVELKGGAVFVGRVGGLMLEVRQSGAWSAGLIWPAAERVVARGRGPNSVLVDRSLHWDFKRYLENEQGLRVSTRVPLSRVAVRMGALLGLSADAYEAHYRSKGFDCVSPARLAYHEVANQVAAEVLRATTEVRPA